MAYRQFGDKSLPELTNIFEIQNCSFFLSKCTRKYRVQNVGHIVLYHNGLTEMISYEHCNDAKLSATVYPEPPECHGKASAKLR